MVLEAAQAAGASAGMLAQNRRPSKDSRLPAEDHGSHSQSSFHSRASSRSRSRGRSRVDDDLDNSYSNSYNSSYNNNINGSYNNNKGNSLRNSNDEEPLPAVTKTISNNNSSNHDRSKDAGTEEEYEDDYEEEYEQDVEEEKGISATQNPGNVDGKGIDDNDNRHMPRVSSKVKEVSSVISGIVRAPLMPLSTGSEQEDFVQPSERHEVEEDDDDGWWFGSARASGSVAQQSQDQHAQPLETDPGSRGEASVVDEVNSVGVEDNDEGSRGLWNERSNLHSPERSAQNRHPLGVVPLEVMEDLYPHSYSPDYHEESMPAVVPADETSVDRLTNQSYARSERSRSWQSQTEELQAAELPDHQVKISLQLKPSQAISEKGLLHPSDSQTDVVGDTDEVDEAERENIQEDQQSAFNIPEIEGKVPTTQMDGATAASHSYSEYEEEFETEVEEISETKQPRDQLSEHRNSSENGVELYKRSEVDLQYESKLGKSAGDISQNSARTIVRERKGADESEDPIGVVRESVCNISANLGEGTQPQRSEPILPSASRQNSPNDRTSRGQTEDDDLYEFFDDDDRHNSDHPWSSEHVEKTVAVVAAAKIEVAADNQSATEVRKAEEDTEYEEEFLDESGHFKMNGVEQKTEVTSYSSGSKVQSESLEKNEENTSTGDAVSPNERIRPDRTKLSISTIVDTFSRSHSNSENNQVGLGSTGDYGHAYSALQPSEERIEITSNSVVPPDLSKKLSSIKRKTPRHSSSPWDKPNSANTDELLSNERKSDILESAELNHSDRESVSLASADERLIRDHLKLLHKSYSEKRDTPRAKKSCSWRADADLLQENRASSVDDISTEFNAPSEEVVETSRSEPPSYKKAVHYRDTPADNPKTFVRCGRAYAPSQAGEISKLASNSKSNSSLASNGTFHSSTSTNGRSIERKPSIPSGSFVQQKAHFEKGDVPRKPAPPVKPQPPMHFTRSYRLPVSSTKDSTETVPKKTPVPRFTHSSKIDAPLSTPFEKLESGDQVDSSSFQQQGYVDRSEKGHRVAAQIYEFPSKPQRAGHGVHFEELVARKTGFQERSSYSYGHKGGNEYEGKHNDEDYIPEDLTVDSSNYSPPQARRTPKRRIRKQKKAKKKKLKNQWLEKDPRYQYDESTGLFSSFENDALRESRREDARIMRQQREQQKLQELQLARESYLRRRREEQMAEERRLRIAQLSRRTTRRKRASHNGQNPTMEYAEQSQVDEEVVSYRRGRNVVLSPPQKTYKYTYNIIQQQRLQQQQQQGHQQEQQEQQRIQRERDEGAFTAVDGADSTSASPDFHQRQNNRHSFLISLKPSDASNENADHYGSNGLNHNIVGENSWQPSAQSSEPTLYEIPFGDSGQHSPSLDSRGTAIGTAGSMEGSNRLVSDITGFTKSLLKTNGQKKQVRVIDDAENISVTFHYEPLLDDKLQCSTENTAENNDHQRHTNFVDSFNGTEVKGETCDPFDVEELTSERRPKRRVTPFTYVNTLSAEEMDSSTDHKKDYPITTANTSLATDKGLATFGGADIVIRSRSRSGSAQDLENAKTPRFHLFLGPAIKYAPQSVDYDEQEEGRLVDPENNHLRSSIESLQYSDDSGSATPVKELQRSGFGNVSTKPVIVVEKNMGTTSGSFNDVDDGDLSLLQGEQLDSFLRTSYNSPKLQVLSKPVRTTEAGQSIDEGLAGYSGANEDDEEEEEATEDDYLGDEEFDSYEEVNTLVAASSPTQKDIDSPAKVVMESINEKPVTLIRSISRHHLDSRDSINKSRDQFDAYTSDSNYVLDADASDKEVRPYVDSHGKKLSRLFSDEDNDAEIDYSYFDDQIAYEEQQQQVQRLSKTARNEDSAALRETGIIDSFETQRNSAIDVAVCTAKKAIASDESDEPEEEYDNDFEEAYDDDDFED